MRQSTPPIILPLKMFGYLHPETRSEPKFPIIGEPSSSMQVNIQTSYENRVKNTSINLEETYGKGFKILSKQGYDTTSELEIHQLLEQPQIETLRGLGYQDPLPNINILLPN